MRPRNKKNFETRFARVSSLLIDAPETRKGRWRELFAGSFPDGTALESLPLHLEIGCGKGSFIYGMAKAHPDVCFLALEIVPSVILMAMEKVFADPEIANVRFISADARRLAEFFAENELDAIYLNFSDPWPRPKHFKNRLTHPDFLRLYKNVLKPGAPIHQKTDNQPLFEYSLARYAEEGFRVNVLAEAPADNIVTEYEQRFMDRGEPIFRADAFNEP